MTYTISARQINRSAIEQQLIIASETMRLRLATVINGELALVLKMADTPIVQQYFQNPSDADLESAADKEFTSFRQHFKDKIVFWVNDVDKIFYSIESPPYVVNPLDPESYWYNMTLYHTLEYNFNINYNPDLQQINLWVNVPVFTNEEDGGKKPIGMLGTGVNLTGFSNSLHLDFDKNIALYLFNNLNEITTAADYDLIANKVLLTDHLGDAGAEIIRIAHEQSDSEIRSFIYDGSMYVVGYIPQLDWYLTAASKLPPNFIAVDAVMNIVFFGMLLLILAIFIVFNIFVAGSNSAIEKQNRQLLEANKKAAAASEAKSNFLAKMSHEIRTPMNAIIGMSELILREDISVTVSDNALNVKQAGTNLLSIINDILDFSKIESGNMEILSEEYRLASLLHDVINIIRMYLDEKAILLNINISDSLPNRLRGDEAHIRQVLLNLLSNAAKYTKKGSVTFSVWGEEEKEKDKDKIILVFQVADTGIGIKEEDMGRLFGEFTQFDSHVNKNVEGTGLGLAITKKLCQALGGDVSVSSVYGEGSVFTASFPQIVIDCTPLGELDDYTFKHNEGEKIGMRFTAPGVRLLIVDDIATNLNVAKGLLSLYQMDITTAISGREAIGLIKQNRYDLVFMDHMMPEMDGIEAVEAIRALGDSRGNSYFQTLPIIALTANAVTGMKEMFLSKGFNDYLFKPIEISKLDGLMDKWIPPEKRINVEKQTSSERKRETTDIKVDRIDTARGLSMTGGTEAGYRKVLAAFRKDALDRLSLFEHDPSEQELSLFTTNVHAIKSAAGTIGAASVSQEAAELEAAGKAGDLALIAERLPHFHHDLKELAEQIGAGLNRVETVEINSEGAGEISAQYSVLFTELAEALKQEDIGLIHRILAELEKKPLEAKTKETISSISNAVLMTEFEEAIREIETLTDKTNSRRSNT
ncbi:hybrid sensor histidine kinase/response regulator [Treponema primitia]|nr:hybrid sensor histidine kinase/response regulator [Treponema primitia]